MKKKIQEVEPELNTDGVATANLINSLLVQVDEPVSEAAPKPTYTVSIGGIGNSESAEKVEPCRIERDPCGLIKGLNYDFDELGFVNYKKLIPREFLVPNRQFFQKRKLSVPDSTDGLPDNQLICLLFGYKWLAATRGFTSVNHKIISASLDSVTVRTRIKWIANYETKFREVTYDALATASLSNTFDFAQNYLAEIAQNRGECRAIRGFLRIPILASDELGPQKEDNSGPAANDKLQPGSPYVTLQKKLNDKNTPFDKFKNFCIGRKIENSDKWNDLFSIDAGQIVNLIELINKKEVEKGEKLL